jgi:hypothetical protein
MSSEQINTTAPPELVSLQTARDPVSAPRLDRRSFYRAVNERIREVNEAFAVFADNVEVFCECGARDCLERVEVPAKVYEEVLSGQRSLVKAGHESPGHGEVVAESGSYVVIETDAGTRREATRSSSSGRRRR